MSDVNVLTAQYLVGAEGGEPAPEQFDNCKVTHVVDADQYNQEIKQALNIVGSGDTSSHYILIHNWWLGLQGGRYVTGSAETGFTTKDYEPYALDGRGGTDLLINRLKVKARAGVKVHAMGWMGAGITEHPANSYGNVRTKNAIWNAGTLRSIAALRDEPQIGFKAITEEVSHTAGAGHIKMLLICSPAQAIAFTGGLDFVNDRWAKPQHLGGEIWHDVMARIEGPAVKGLWDWYANIWAEVIGRAPVRYRLIDATGGTPRAIDVAGHSASRDPATGTPPLPAYPRSSTNAGNHRVQSLRTSPMSRFDAPTTKYIKASPPLSFAPNGIREFQRAVRKAIRGARKYIYMEDQFFYSQEIMEYVHDAVAAHSDLRVIFLTGGPDPNDPAFPPSFLAQALNVGLLKGASGPGQTDLTGEQRSHCMLCVRGHETKVETVQITNVGGTSAPYRLTLDPTAFPTEPYEADYFSARDAYLTQGTNFFRVTGNPAMTPGQNGLLDVTIDTVTGASPSTGSANLYTVAPLFVHAKVLLVDDACAIVGSANAIRRSLYTDIEHSVAFVDPDDQAVKALRCALWSDHFRQPASSFDNIDQALFSWNPGWGAQSTVRLPPHIVVRPLPFPSNLPTAREFDLYNLLVDVDSRQEWGGLERIVRLYGAMNTPTP